MSSLEAGQHKRKAKSESSESSSKKRVKVPFLNENEQKTYKNKRATIKQLQGLLVTKLGLTLKERQNLTQENQEKYFAENAELVYNQFKVHELWGSDFQAISYRLLMSPSSTSESILNGSKMRKLYSRIKRMVNNVLLPIFYR